MSAFKDAFAFELGSELQDTITGFKGIAVSRTQWLNACNVYGLQPKELKDGRPQERCHFDEPQLVLVKVDAVKPAITDASKRTGGDAKPVYEPNR